MTEAELRTRTLAILSGIVPELEPERLDARVAFRDQIEIDSIDYLNFVLSLEKELGIKVAEMDYPQLASLDGCVAYLLPKVR